MKKIVLSLCCLCLILASDGKGNHAIAQSAKTMSVDSIEALYQKDPVAALMIFRGKAGDLPATLSDEDAINWGSARAGAGDFNVMYLLALRYQNVGDYAQAYRWYAIANAVQSVDSLRCADARTTLQNYTYGTARILQQDLAATRTRMKNDTAAYDNAIAEGVALVKRLGPDRMLPFSICTQGKNALKQQAELMRGQRQSANPFEVDLYVSNADWPTIYQKRIEFIEKSLAQ